MEYFFTARRRSGGQYTHRIGPIRYLEVPENAPAITPAFEIGNSASWFNKVQHAAGGVAGGQGEILFFVHGFNVEQHQMRARHRKIVAGLKAHGFQGVVVSFDWPSDGDVIGYASDRLDARMASNYLLDKGIAPFARRQTPDCRINLHILAHSMGCFVVREAFDYADDAHAVAQHNWSISQAALVAADISAKSLLADSPKTSSLLRHTVRLTNYYNPFDEVLSISEVKRIGVARRLGRVGLPEPRAEKCVNLYCGKYFNDHRGDFESRPDISHNWYFNSPRFYEDLAYTLAGKLDRAVIPTRDPTNLGNLALVG